MTRNHVLPMLFALALAPIAAVPSVAQRNQLDDHGLPFIQLDMAAIPRLNPEGVRKVQQLLKDKGLNPGPIDGVMGPLTTEAVRDFQNRYGIRVKGEIDNQTLFALGAVDLAGQGAR